MGFSIANDWNGIGTSLLVFIAIGVAIPVIVWFIALTKQAHDEVVEDTDHDIEA